ncbi:MAG: metallophosphoesterase, partial [Pseudomonadota bacterium]
GHHTTEDKMPMNYWFTADTHFGRGIIVPFRRPYRTWQEMHEALIGNWNMAVQLNDVVYHLGDFGIGVDGELEEIFGRLHGHKILVRGNHDSDRVLGLGWTDMAKEAAIRVGRQTILLSHRPHLEWKGKEQGVWHLFGHVHRRRGYGGKSLNVGVDCWEFFPVGLDRITHLLG